MPCCPVIPEIDEMLTIDPPPAAFMIGILDGTAGEPGIVDENVELAEFGEGGLDGRPPFRFARHVETAEDRRPVRVSDVGDDPPPFPSSISATTTLAPSPAKIRAMLEPIPDAHR